VINRMVLAYLGWRSDFKTELKYKICAENVDGLVTICFATTHILNVVDNRNK